MTQLFYGLILVLSLLLTLLVPVVGRHLYFISPFDAFIVLGVMVAGIMLQVSTDDVYLAAANAAAEAKPPGDLMTRYLILPPADPSGVAPLSLSPLQKTVFALAAALVTLTLALRLMVAEAMAVRLGAFLYLFVSALILLVFFVVAEKSHAAFGLRPAMVMSEWR